MQRKHEKRDEASFLHVETNIPGMRDCRALNAYLCTATLLYSDLWYVSEIGKTLF